MSDRRRVRCIALALAFSAACTTEHARRDATTARTRATPAVQATTAVPATPVAANAAAQASVPYYLDPSEDCGLLRTMLFPEPLALVKHFVALDNDARFLGTGPEADSLYVCPSHLPGPDEFTVVTRSDVDSLSVTDSVARVIVRSRRLGEMTQDSLGLLFARDPGVVVDTFVVLHTPFGWRIESPQLPNRVLGSAVIAHAQSLRLRTVVRDSLLAAMARTGN
jgi:hypothetical protein